MGNADLIKQLNEISRRNRDRRFFFDYEFCELIRRDEKEKFILEICRSVNKFSSRAQELLREVLRDPPSIKCAEALITGQTPLTVNLNLPCVQNGMYPLHFVAFEPYSPSIIELLLCYGAQTNIRLTPCTNTITEYANMLPLQIALQRTT